MYIPIKNGETVIPFFFYNIYKFVCQNIFTFSKIFDIMSLTINWGGVPMSNSNKKLKRSRFFDAPLGCSSLAMHKALILTLIASVMSAAVPSGYGGLMFVALSGGIFAYVLTARWNLLLLLLAGGASFGASVLLSSSPVLSLLSLAYIVLAVAIAVSVRFEWSLTKTVLCQTVIVLSIAGIGTLVFALTDFGALSAFADSLITAFEELFRGYMSSLEATLGGEITVSKTTLDALLEATMMMLPGAAVVLIMSVCYITAKIFRFAAFIGDSSMMFEGGEWPVTMSLAASLVFAASLLVSVFSGGLVMYAASNLMIMLLPGMSLYGLRMMFGRRSHFRNGMSGLSKILLVLWCAALFYLGIPYLLSGFSLYGTFYNIRRALILSRIKNNKN